MFKWKYVVKQPYQNHKYVTIYVATVYFIRADIAE